MDSPMHAEFEFYVDEPLLRSTRERTPAVAYCRSGERHEVEHDAPHHDEKRLPLHRAPWTAPARAGLDPCPVDWLTRWATVIVYVSLVLAITHLGHNCIRLGQQLRQARGSLEASDRRGTFLAERVAWLEASLADATSEPRVLSPSSSGLEGLEWRDTIDLAVAAIELEGRVEDLEEQIEFCRAQKRSLSSVGHVDPVVYDSLD